MGGSCYAPAGQLTAPTDSVASRRKGVTDDSQLRVAIHRFRVEVERSWEQRHMSALNLYGRL